MGTVALLDCDAIEPGQWGLAQLFLEEPATTVWGQPFVLRTSSAEQTLGGGQVLQPVGKKIRRRHLDVLERVERLWAGDAAERARTVAWFAGFSGVTPADLVRGASVGPDEVDALLASLVESRGLVDMTQGSGKRLLLHADMIGELEERVLQVLARMHE